jgi:DNA-binding Lrp family transcriptional regulator
MAYTLQSKVGELLKDPEAMKIIERYAPGISKNPMIGLAKGMTLQAVVSLPQAKDAGLTEDMIKQVLTEINAQK